MHSNVVKLSELICEFSLKPIYIPKKPDDVLILTHKLNRPGLGLCGCYKCFDPLRLQVIGNMEISYLKSIPRRIRFRKLVRLCRENVPAVIVAGGGEVFAELVEAAKICCTPILQTKEDTFSFMCYLGGFLNAKLGAKTIVHGVFVEVCGEGVLITGESGVGKSETAMELIKRGHRLVADDAVSLTRVCNKTLIASSPKNIMHFMEVRGVGIVNVKELYGIKSIKATKKLDIVVHLEQVENKFKLQDRLVYKDEYCNILNVKVKKYTVAVKPGRNLAIIIEVAAISNIQKKTGYSACEDLFSKLGLSW